ncbi:hypothetical protein IKE99_02135 [Candidatus Saccharibacteria bacterium]|nr:hypothetical protein [Candidatus Saccharibacteria bacterium]
MIILTDLSEVLIKGVYGMDRIIERNYGLEVSTSFMKRKYVMKSSFEDLMRGCMTEDQFWERFLSGQKWPFGVTEIKGILSRNMAEEIPGTLDLYESIVKYPRTVNGDHRNLLQGRPEFWLVSDHIAERQQELEHLHPETLGLMTRRIWSYDEIALKKDPGYFARLMKNYDLNKDEVLYIDDDMENIYASAKAGVHHIWFRNALQLRYTLSRAGFRFSRQFDRVFC